MNCYKSFKYLKQFKALNCCYSLCYSDDWFHLGKKNKNKSKTLGWVFLKRIYDFCCDPYGERDGLVDWEEGISRPVNRRCICVHSRCVRCTVLVVRCTKWVGLSAFKCALEHEVGLAGGRVQCCLFA